MALSSLFRRASTCMLKPIQLGAFGSSEIVHLFTSSSSLKAVESSTSTKKKNEGIEQQSFDSDDEKWGSYLTSILNSEIKFARDSDFLHCTVDIPEGFPFTIQDNAGWRTVVLERKFQGETITLLIDIPSPPAEQSDDDNETDHKEPSFPLVVIISKEENGLLLEFDARVRPGGISVHGMAINRLADSKDGVKYLGPDFLKLKQNLQKAIHDYLETRGLTSRTANFLLQHMMVKDAKEYLQWLRTLNVLIGQN